MKQKKMLVYLHAKIMPTASWVRWNENNEIITSVEQGDLAQLSQFAADLIYVVLPNEDVLLTQTTLPTLSRARLLQALPYALEEQLIPDVSELHFAIGKHQSDLTLPVAIVSKEKMREWLNLLQTLDLHPVAFIPAAFLLSIIANEWHVNTYNNECLVRTSPWIGFACQQSQLATWLSLKQAEDKLTELPTITHTEFSHQQLLEQYGQTLLTSPSLNLLQGEYQPKRQKSRTRTLWRAVLGLLLTYVILALIGNTISFLILRNQTAFLEKQIAEIYFRQFPKAATVVAPKQRMTEKLRKLEGSHNKNVYFILVGELGKNLMKLPGVKIQHLTFNDQYLTVEMNANSFDEVDQIKNALLQAHLNVKQQSANSLGKQVKVTLIISAGKL